MSVNDAGRLSVTVAGALQMPVSTYTLGSVNGCTNEYAAVSSTTLAPVSAATLTLNGTNIINVISGSLATGSIYPLISYGTINGSGAIRLGTIPAGVTATLGTNVVNGTNTIALTVVSGNATADVWSGKTSGNWDMSTAGNWTNSGVAVLYADGDNVRFDDTASAFTVTTASTNFYSFVAPGNITVSNNTSAYIFNGVPIAQAGTLTKSGTSTLTVNTVNTGFGSIALNAGTITLGNGASLGSGTLTMSNGTSFVLSSGGTTFPANPIFVPAGASVNISGSGALGNGISGTISSGDSTSVINITSTVSFNATTTQFDSFLEPSTSIQARRCAFPTPAAAMVVATPPSTSSAHYNREMLACRLPWVQSPAPARSAARKRQPPAP